MAFTSTFSLPTAEPQSFTASAGSSAQGRRSQCGYMQAMTTDQGMTRCVSRQRELDGFWRKIGGDLNSPASFSLSSEKATDPSFVSLGPVYDTWRVSL